MKIRLSNLVFVKSYHAGQKEDDDERVHDGKPLNVCVRHRVENVVPPRGPLDLIVLVPLDGVGIRDFERIAFDVFIVAGNCHGFGGVALAGVYTFEASRLDFYLDDSAGRRRQDLVRPLGRIFRLVDGDGELDMVEDVVGIGGIERSTDHARVFLLQLFRYVTADRKS